MKTVLKCISLKMVIWSSILIFGCLPSLAQAGQKEVLKLVSIPWRDAPTLEQIYEPMIKLLEDRLGKPVHFYVSTDYKELGQRLVSEAADIGIFGGNSYVEARQNHPEIKYIATCMQPTAYYSSLIIVRKDSGLHTLSDLRGKSFAFTDKGSTSGYLYPLLMLASKGINPETNFGITYFLEKHDKVYNAIAKGVIHAGGVSRTALEPAKKRNGDVYRILSRSAPIPRNAVVAGSHLSKQEVTRIREILSSAEQSDIFKTSDSILKGFSIQNDRFYDIVREAIKLKK